MTGGRIVEIQVNPQHGRTCAYHKAVLGFWTLTAGYLGSLLWGGLILLLAARTRLDKAISVLIGLGMVAISIGFGESTFTYLFGIGFGVVLLVIGFFLPEAVNDWILRVIGVSGSCLYAILDIKSDVLDRAHLRSDARMLSEGNRSPNGVLGYTLDSHRNRAYAMVSLSRRGKTPVVQEETSPEEDL